MSALESTESLIENLKQESFQKQQPSEKGSARALADTGGRRKYSTVAVLAALEAGPTLAARPLAPPRRLKKPVGLPRDPKLQDSLAALECAAEGASKRTGGSVTTPAGHLSICLCRRFAIGRAKASTPSCMDFFGDWLDERRKDSVRMVM